MNKAGAIAAMRNGKKVTHRYFTDEEYIYMVGAHIYSEEGVKHGTADDFFQFRASIEWETDWELFLNEEEKAKLKVLMVTMDVIKSGYAGVLPNGNIVDRREHPEAVPCQENALFNTPKPKEI